MKYPALAILVLLATAGCGKVEVQMEAGTIQARTFSAATVEVTETMKSELKNVCQILADKERMLRNNFVNSAGRFNFDIVQNNCGTEEVNSKARARVVLVSDVLQYETLSGDYFNSQIETRATGVVSLLCADVNGIVQPLVMGDLAFRFDVSRGSECSNNTKYRCVTVETAQKQTNGTYLVNKVDKFQIDTTPGVMIGTVMRHEHWNYALCNENAKLVNVATFTGITN